MYGTGQVQLLPVLRGTDIHQQEPGISQYCFQCVRFDYQVMRWHRTTGPEAGAPGLLCRMFTVSNADAVLVWPDYASRIPRADSCGSTDK